MRHRRIDRQARATQTQTTGFVCVSQLLALQEPCPEQVLSTPVLLEEAESLGCQVAQGLAESQGSLSGWLQASGELGSRS